MLSDTDIERYARQIVLPEVGGRGQERLLASRVAVLGGGRAASLAADLLRRAGVSVCDDPAEGGAAAVVIDFDGGAGTRPDAPRIPVLRAHLDGTCATLTVLAAAPCPRCDASVARTGVRADPLTACGLHALGALAANEALLALLAPTPRVRRYTIDLSTGILAASMPARCPHGGWSV
jgi:hypothetical protein